MIDRPPGIDLEQLFVLLYRLLTGSGGDVSFDSARVFFFDIWVKVAIVSSIITPILLAALAYVVIRNHQMRAEEEETYKAKARMPHLEAAHPKNEQWEHVLEMVSSDRPSDWRVAVMDADVMLDELLIQKGYLGENLGERLKSVSPGDFRALNAAWEAHKIRNQIAHGGGDYILTQREARRAVDLFREVFAEIGVI